jgi:hypothetical protein
MSQETRSEVSGPRLLRPGLLRPGLLRPGLLRPGLLRPGLLRPSAAAPNAARPQQCVPDTSRDSLHVHADDSGRPQEFLDGIAHGKFHGALRLGPPRTDFPPTRFSSKASLRTRQSPTQGADRGASGCLPAWMKATASHSNERGVAAWHFPAQPFMMSRICDSSSLTAARSLLPASWTLGRYSSLMAVIFDF